MSEFSIRPSKDVRNNYASISKLCKERPVAVTVNGREDTVMMSHEQFLEQQRQIQDMQGQLDFYAHLAQSEDDIALGRISSSQQVFAELKEDLAKFKV